MSLTSSSIFTSALGSDASGQCGSSWANCERFCPCSSTTWRERNLFLVPLPPTSGPYLLEYMTGEWQNEGQLRWRPAQGHQLVHPSHPTNNFRTWRSQTTNFQNLCDRIWNICRTLQAGLGLAGSICKAISISHPLSNIGIEYEKSSLSKNRLLS